MSHATFRFYAQLNDFLPSSRRQQAFIHSFEKSPSIKDMIESLGVPHTEVRLILVEGQPVDFDYHVQDGNSISVYPAFTRIDITPLIAAPAEARFVLDVHLGRLASHLRMLGFDTLYRNDYDDPELARISRDEDRILLTRDLGLLKRSMVKHGYYVRNTNPARQLAEVLRQFRLTEINSPFMRCMQCNGLLEDVEKTTIMDRLPTRTAQFYDEFRICHTCDKIYWKGSHYQHMRQMIERIRAGSDVS